VQLANGGDARVIAGALTQHGTTVRGPINGRAGELSTDPTYLDIRLPAGAEFSAPLTAGHNAFLYTYEGSAEIGADGAAKRLPHRSAGVLSDGDIVRVKADDAGVRFLLLAAKPLREPGGAIRAVRDEHARGNRAGASPTIARAVWPLPKKSAAKLGEADRGAEV